MLAALAFATLAVDSGRLWLRTRQLQSVADMAALAAAGSLRCTAAPGANLASVQAGAVAAAQAAAVANGFKGDLSTAPNEVSFAAVQPDVNGRNTLLPLIPFPPAALPAVTVVAAQEEPASLFAGGLWGQTVVLTQAATAAPAPPRATYSIGSSLLRVSTTAKDATLLNGIIGDMLGSTLNLNAVSYQGLANADVSLADLVRASATAGSVEQLLNADLTVAEVVNLAAEAVGHDQTLTATLNGLRLAAVNNTVIQLGSILDVSLPGSSSAGEARVNLFDLLLASIMLANGQSAIAIPNLAINLPGLTANAQVSIIQPPQIGSGEPGIDVFRGGACGTAQTAQVSARAVVNGNVPLGLVSAALDLVLTANVAQGSAVLVPPFNPGPGPATVTVNATPGIASVNLANAAGTGPATATVAISLPIIGTINVIIDIGLNLPIQPAGPTPLTFTVDQPVASNLPVTQPVASPVGGSLANALTTPGAITLAVRSNLIPPELLTLVNAALALPLQLLSPIIAGLLTALDTELLNPLLRSLGIQLGGMDVTVTGIAGGNGAAAQLVL
jgi:uncharacterized membrane protein